MKKLMSVLLVALLAAVQAGCPLFNLGPNNQREYRVEMLVNDGNENPIGDWQSVSTSVLRDIQAAENPGPVDLRFSTVEKGDAIVLRRASARWQTFSGDSVFVNFLERDKVEHEKSIEAAAVAFLIVGGLWGEALLAGGHFVAVVGGSALEAWIREQTMTSFQLRVPFGPSVSSATVDVEFDFVNSQGRVLESVTFNRTIRATSPVVPVPDMTVPSLTGQYEGQAIDSLRFFGFQLGDISTACSDEVEFGRVISSDPSSGVSLPFGATINLVVSNGQRCTPRTAPVPNLAGQFEWQAGDTLRLADFIVGEITHECSATVGRDRVIRTSPAAGSVRNLGTAINLVVSTGSCPPQTGSVPNVVGNTQAVATTAITNAGFTVGTVTTTCSDTVSTGKVISYSPSGTRNLGTAINLVVSSGNCPPQTGTVPDVTGKTQFKAESDIINAGFIVGTVTTTCSDTVSTGKVISYSPSGTRNLGTAINLVVSTGSCPVADLEVSFKVRNQQGQFVVLPSTLVVPLGHSRVFELAINGGKPDYLVTLLDYDGHGIQFRVWQKGKEEVLVDETHFVLSPDQLAEFDMAEDQAAALDEIFMLKGVEVLNRVGATLSVDWVGPNATVRITKDFTATTQVAQPAYLFVSDSSETMEEVELTWKVQVE